MKWLAFALLPLFAGVAAADDKKPPSTSPLALKVVLKKEKYTFDGGGQTSEEYKKGLEATAKAIAKGERVTPPKPLPVDLVLKIENTSKEEVTIYVGGDANVPTLDLTGGAGVVTMNNPVAFTLDLRLPQAVTLGPGKAHEIPVKQLSDGARGMSRLVFWTGPGEYTLTAKYTLADKMGGKGAELKSEPVKLTVEK